MRHVHLRPRLKDQAGVTLIELMISMLLASVLSAGLFYMMSSQQRTYTEQLSVMTAQQNITGAMEYLQGQIWKAGYGFTSCGGEVRAYQSGASITINAFSMQNAFNLYTGTTDPYQSDSFSVSYNSDAGGGQLGVKIVQKMPSSSAVLKTNASGNIKANDILVIWKPGSDLWCSVMQATQDAQPEKGGQQFHVSHNPKSSWNPPGGHSIFPPGGYPLGSIVMNLGQFTGPRHFAIDRSQNPPLLVTWTRTDRTDVEVIAGGIDDMQLSYACDMNNDGILDEGKTDAERTNDEWADNVAGDVPPSCVDATTGEPIVVGLVRLTLIFRTAGPVIGDKSGFRPGAEDHSKGSPNDDLKAAGKMGTYSRVVLTNTIKPRNIRRRVQ